ncbi:MAG: hypothetical protein WC767_00710 [Candidatus Paceibacterota bacterium]|jgi:hypothetical protein
MKNMKIIYIVGIIIVVAAAAYGAEKLKLFSKEDPCVLPFQAVVFEDTSKLLSKEAAAEKLLAQFLTAYTATPRCYTYGVKDWKIAKVGKATDVGPDFTIPVSFDLIPLSAEKTLWKTPETEADGEWIRGKEATLGIRAASSTYMLVLP